MVQPDAAAFTGSARIALPSLPVGYLTDSGQTALFELTVTGPGDTSLHRWALSPQRQDPILVDGLAAGLNHFQGRLFRIDSAGSDSAVTHEGENSAFIRRDSVTEVRLTLKAGGSGRAHICLDVEGWPTDPTCATDSTGTDTTIADTTITDTTVTDTTITDTTVTDTLTPPPPLQSVFGCWAIEVVSGDSALPGDSVLQGHLIIVRRDSMMAAEITWSSGRVDTSSALYEGGSVIYFGEGAHGDFIFKAHLDRKDSLYGPFVFLSNWGDNWYGRAVRTTCLPEAAENRRCFEFKQYGVSSHFYGRMGIETDGEAAAVTLHWEGVGARLGRGALAGDWDSSASVSGWVNPPPGLFTEESRTDTVSFQFQVNDSGLLGTIESVGDSTTSVGEWVGFPILCVSHIFRH